MAELFYHQSCRISIEYFVNRRHGAHLHQGLDHVTGLDGHALCEIGDRDRIGDFDTAHHRCGRLLKAVQVIQLMYLTLTFLEFLLTVGLMRRFLDVQFLASVTGMLVVVLAVLTGLLRCSNRTRLGRFIECNTRSRLGSFSRQCRGTFTLNLFLRDFNFLQTSCISLFLGLGSHRVFDSLLFGCDRCCCGFFNLARFLFGLALKLLTLLLDLGHRFQLNLLFFGDHFRASHVGAFLAHFDINRLGGYIAARVTGYAQFALAFALQRDLLRTLTILFAMTAAQRFQQLEFVFVRDRVVSILDLDARIFELVQ